MVKDFDSLFGLQSSLEEEKKRFVARINQSIFNYVKKADYYERLFRHICFILGIEPSRYIQKNGDGVAFWNEVNSLKVLTKDDFFQTIKIIQIIYEYSKEQTNSHYVQTLKLIDQFIPKTIELSAVELGIKWQDGRFLPTREKELDKELIDKTMQWLNQFPNEKKDFASALDSLISKKNLGNVITNCYNVVEGLAREFLNNNKTLENNQEDLIKKLNISQKWKNIIISYIRCAHEFRHASESRHGINELEAETFLYLTGVLTRLIVKSKE